MYTIHVMRRGIHTSWLVAVACVGMAMGVVMSQYLPQGLFGSISWLLTATALMGFVAWRRLVWAIPIAIVAGLLLGFWRGSVERAQLDIYDSLYGQTIVIEGAIGEDLDINARGQFVVRLHAIVVDDVEYPGMIWVTFENAAGIKRGDRVIAQGRVSEGFGSFNAAMYQANIIDIRSDSDNDIALQARDGFAEAVRRAVPEPEASLGVGYLVGQRRSLPPELDQALQITGLMHVVVASGYNLTILVRLARRLFEKVSKYLSALAAGGMIVSFIAVTGMSPSMSRAGLVAGLSLLAWYYGRRFHPLVLLPFAAATTLMVNPVYGWGDLGWQLSFAAFAGVMIVAPLFQAYYFGDKKPGIVRQVIGETLAAWLCTLPILMLAFGQLSTLAVIANALVLPLVPLAMLLTFVAGVVTLAIPGLNQLAGFPAQAILEYMTQIIQQLANIEWAQLDVTIEWWHAALLYAVFIVFTTYMWWRTRLKLGETSIVE